MLFTSGNYRVNNSNMTFALLFKFISHSQSVSILLSSALYLMFEDYNFFSPSSACANYCATILTWPPENFLLTN